MVSAKKRVTVSSNPQSSPANPLPRLLLALLLPDRKTLYRFLSSKAKRRNFPVGSYLHHTGRGKLHITPLDAAFFKNLCLFSTESRKTVGDYESTINLTIVSVTGSINNLRCCKSKELL